MSGGLPRLVVVGAGVLGGRVAQAWAARGGAVRALTRTPQRHAALRAAGVPASIAPVSEVVRPEDVVLMAISGSTGQHAALTRLASRARPRRLVLCSSVGVYGVPSGRVDAATRLGETPRSRAIFAAEEAARSWGGDRAVVLRLGGLYQAGRGPVSALKRRGTPPEGPPDRTLALLHYDDAASAALAALQHGSPQPTYVVVGPRCPTRREFYALACRRHQLAPPHFTEPLGVPPADYALDALRRDLLPQWSHPDWREATA